MVLECAVKLFVPRILNCGLDKLKSVFKQPQILEAFEKACSKVLLDKKMSLDSYALQSLIYSSETINGENLAGDPAKGFR